MAQLLAHTVVVVALVAAYTVVTVTGHDGTPMLGILGGYIAGAGAQAGFTRAGSVSK